MRKSTESMTGSRPRRRSGPGTVRPGLIGSMSFRLAIPRRAGPHKRPLPLRQPPAIVRYTRFASRGFFIERRTHSYLFVSALGPTPRCLQVLSRFQLLSEVDFQRSVNGEAKGKRAGLGLGKAEAIFEPDRKSVV